MAVGTKLFLFIVCNCLHFCYSSKSYNCKTEDKFTFVELEFCLPNNYSNVHPPSLNNLDDRFVKLRPLIHEIYSVNMAEAYVGYKMNFLVLWKDSRIILRDHSLIV